MTATLAQEREKLAFSQTYLFYTMLSLPGGSSLVLFQSLKLQFWPR